MSGAEGLDMDIKISYPDTAFSIPQMTELVKAVTAARVDAIIAQGNEDSEYISALNAASENGILIAFVDTDIDGFSKRLYVGTDNYAAGRFIAEKLIEIVDGITNVAVLMGANGFPSLDSRLEGLRDGIADNDTIRLLVVELTDFDAIKTIEKYRSIMNEKPDVNAIICLDGSGGAAIASEIGPSDPSAATILCFGYGLGVRRAIRNGIIAGTIVQSETEMGEKAVQALYECIKGQQPLPDVIYTDISFITSAELGDSVNEY